MIKVIFFPIRILPFRNPNSQNCEKLIVKSLKSKIQLKFPLNSNVFSQVDLIVFRCVLTSHQHEWIVDLLRVP